MKIFEALFNLAAHVAGIALASGLYYMVWNDCFVEIRYSPRTYGQAFFTVFVVVGLLLTGDWIEALVSRKHESPSDEQAENK